jgi:regulator of cell morphogenesis and NO signaling
MTKIDPNRTLASLVNETPSYARAFESLDLDYCCNGDRTLRRACRQAGVDVEAVCEQLVNAREEVETDEQDWETLAELAEHVVSVHHDYLREELPALEDLVTKVDQVHGENHPELHDVAAEFRDLSGEMREHIEEEESELFPIVERLDRGESLTPEQTDTLHEAIRTFEEDHASTADRLDRIAELTDDYAVPEDACASYRAMLERLEELERDTHRHVHKEDNVLFPAAEERLSITGARGD